MQTFKQFVAESWTPRKASAEANKIYAAHKAGQISDADAKKMLIKMEDALIDSQASYGRYTDWLNFVKNNPDFYKK